MSTENEELEIRRREYIRGFQDARSQKPKRYIKSGDDEMYNKGYAKGEEED